MTIFRTPSVQPAPTPEEQRPGLGSRELVVARPARQAAQSGLAWRARKQGEASMVSQSVAQVSAPERRQRPADPKTGPQIQISSSDFSPLEHEFFFSQKAEAEASNWIRDADHLAALLEEPGEAPERMRNQELITRVIKRQPGAFDEFYYAYVDRVHRHLFSIVGPDAELDDLVQQTFVQVYRCIHTYRGDARFSTWLHRVTVNVALQHLRKRSRWFRWEDSGEALPALTPSAPELPEETAGRREKLRLLHQVLDNLKPKKRIVFVLYEIEGHTLEEISELVEASINTVAGRLRAARREVRKSMERKLKARRAVA